MLTVSVVAYGFKFQLPTYKAIWTLRLGSVALIQFQNHRDTAWQTYTLGDTYILSRTIDQRVLCLCDHLFTSWKPNAL